MTVFELGHLSDIEGNVKVHKAQECRLLLKRLGKHLRGMTSKCEKIYISFGGYQENIQRYIPFEIFICFDRIVFLNVYLHHSTPSQQESIRKIVYSHQRTLKTVQISINTVSLFLNPNGSTHLNLDSLRVYNVKDKLTVFLFSKTLNYLNVGGKGLRIFNTLTDCDVNGKRYLLSQLIRYKGVSSSKDFFTIWSNCFEDSIFSKRMLAYREGRHYIPGFAKE